MYDENPFVSIVKAPTLMKKKLLAVLIIILLIVGGVGLYLNSDLASVISVIDIGDDVNQSNPIAEVTGAAVYK